MGLEGLLNYFENPKEGVRNFLLSGKKSLFHPNRVSFYGAVSTVGSFPLILSDNPYASTVGLSLLGFGLAADGLDGFLARRYSLQSVEGAKLDPLFDKVKNVGAGLVIVGNEASEISLDNLEVSFVVPSLLALSYGWNFVVDYDSQKRRGDITPQFIESSEVIIKPQNSTLDTRNESEHRAVNYGKYKTGIQSGAMIGYFGEKYVSNHDVLNKLFDVGYEFVEKLSYSNNLLVASSLVVAAVLGRMGISKRNNLVLN